MNKWLGDMQTAWKYFKPSLSINYLVIRCKTLFESLLLTMNKSLSKNCDKTQFSKKKAVMVSLYMFITFEVTIDSL